MRSVVAETAAEKKMEARSTNEVRRVLLLTMLLLLLLELLGKDESSDALLRSER